MLNIYAPKGIQTNGRWNHCRYRHWFARFGQLTCLSKYNYTCVSYNTKTLSRVSYRNLLK